jgi:hypothetical protein
MNNRNTATEPTVETQGLFKPKPRKEINLINVQNELRTLSEVNQHAFECLVAHCQNNNRKISPQILRFIFQHTPVLCLRTGQVPLDVRKLVLESIENKGGIFCVKDNPVEAAPEQPSPN